MKTVSVPKYLLLVSHPYLSFQYPEKASQILRTCINLIRIFAILSAPLMPTTSEKMLAKLGLKLSDMEFDILKLQLQGLKQKEIAQTLHISLKSVENALSRIRTKINI